MKYDSEHLHATNVATALNRRRREAAGQVLGTVWCNDKVR